MIQIYFKMIFDSKRMCFKTKRKKLHCEKISKHYQLIFSIFYNKQNKSPQREKHARNTNFNNPLSSLPTNLLANQIFYLSVVQHHLLLVTKQLLPPCSVGYHLHLAELTVLDDPDHPSLSLRRTTLLPLDLNLPRLLSRSSDLRLLIG